MEQRQIIERLRTRATKDTAANAVFYVWSCRQRARNQVTMHALEYKMKAEGFNFTSRQYGAVLEELASLGLGKLEKDSRGRVTALKDVKTTLQSIGQVAVGQKLELAAFKEKSKFTELSEKVSTLSAIATQVKDPVLQFPVSLTVVVNGKPVNFRIPPGLSAEEISKLVKMFQDGAAR